MANNDGYGGIEFDYGDALIIKGTNATNGELVKRCPNHTMSARFIEPKTLLTSLKDGRVLLKSRDASCFVTCSNVT